jgi:exopolysaccharide/PEP-CTERM locus tyrosine autokinase
MSRIEKALEKAASMRKREGVEPAAAADQVSLSSPVMEPGKPSLDELLAADPVAVANPKLVALRDKNDIAFEEYNKLRSLIIKLTQGEKFSNTLMVTSCIGEEGKSLTSLNLAIALARGFDHTVLLVDTDFRRPTLHLSLGIKPETGLIQCLRDDLPISKALIKTGIGKLVFLPAGGAVSKPVEMLGSKKMKEIINELKNRYPERYVIFDTPPVLPFADAQVLAPEVDGFIFVVREGRTRLNDVKKALQTLQGSNMLGVVYNDALVSMKNKSHYYYS